MLMTPHLLYCTLIVSEILNRWFYFRVQKVTLDLQERPDVLETL